MALRIKTNQASRVIASLMLFLICSGCSVFSRNSLRGELINRGPYPLSKSNPYIVTNRFLANEMNNSPVVSGFIETEGTPDAIEASKKLLRPLRIYVFYMDTTQAYLLLEGSDEWIIRGPEQIPPQYLSQLRGFEPAGRQAALAFTTGYGDEPAPASAKRKLVSTPRRNSIFDGEESTPPAVIERTGQVERLPSAHAPQEQFTPPQQPLEHGVPTFSDGRVRVSQYGDVIHTVEHPGETLRIIARWYTGNVDNSERIARINGIGNPNVLKLGEVVRIPRYLLRTTDALPASQIK